MTLTRTLAARSASAAKFKAAAKRWLIGEPGLGLRIG
jgi:hypothetical protein